MECLYSFFSVCRYLRWYVEGLVREFVEVVLDRVFSLSGLRGSVWMVRGPDSETWGISEGSLGGSLWEVS